MTFFWLARILGEERGEVVDVDGLVLEEDVLVLVDGDDEVRCSVSCVDRAGVRDGDLNAGLQHRRGEHEDEQQHQHHVDQRRDVDVGQRGLGSAVGGEGHG